MNNVRALVQAAHSSSDPHSALQSDRMLAELLALNEEMIGQLRLELRDGGSSSEFLSSMINQHEKTAALLRARIEGRAVELDINEVDARPRGAFRSRFATG